MPEDLMLKCMIAFVLGFLVARMMRGNGLSVGGRRSESVYLNKDTKKPVKCESGQQFCGCKFFSDNVATNESTGMCEDKGVNFGINGNICECSSDPKSYPYEPSVKLGGDGINWDQELLG